MRRRSDLEFINAHVDKGALARLEQVAATPFKRVSYTEAVEVLQAAVAAKKKKFEFKVEWGIDLASEHERYLTEEVYGQPIIVYNYPKEIKVRCCNVVDGLDRAVVEANKRRWIISSCQDHHRFTMQADLVCVWSFCRRSTCERTMMARLSLPWTCWCPRSGSSSAAAREKTGLRCAPMRDSDNRIRRDAVRMSRPVLLCKH